MANQPMRLYTLLGDYPNTLPLKKGQVTSPLVSFDFVEAKVPHEFFKPLVREHKFDVGELAIVTYLLAKSFDKPYVLMPVVVMGRGQHHTIFYNAERGPLKPNDLAGKRVGIRSYSVTTVTWLRGILQNDYGVDLNRVKWVTLEDPHVAEYQDPAGVERAPSGKKLLNMLLDGEVDAAVLGDSPPADPRIKHLIPNPHETAKEWAKKNGGVPINHLFVVRKSLSKERPDVVREVYRLLGESKKAAGLPKPGEPDPIPYGFEANRQALARIVKYAAQQKVIPREFSVEELFDETTRALN